MSQEHLKTMVCAKFGEKTKGIMGNAKIENWSYLRPYSKVAAILMFFCLYSNNPLTADA